MPFVTPSEMAKIETFASKQELAREREKSNKRKMLDKGKQALEVVGAATVLGAIRGKFEESGKSFVIPGTDVDISALAGVGLVVASYMNAFGKYSDDFFNAGLGISAAYGSQIGRQFGKTGKLALVAGDMDDALNGAAG